MNNDARKIVTVGSKDIKNILDFLPAENCIVFVDLDGTLTDLRINNTYHFIKAYYVWKRKRFRLLISNTIFNPGIIKILEKITKVLSLFKINVSTDGILIYILTVGLPRDELLTFSLQWIKILAKLGLFRDFLTKLIDTLQNRGCKMYLLTGCTEFPACVIACFYKFNGCFSRKFKIHKSSIIVGLEDYSNIEELKYKFISRIRHVSRNKKLNIYICDQESMKNEQKILRFFDMIFIIY